MPVQTQLQQRRGTAASWTSTNPTLAAGEIGFESDTGKFKIGNGSTAWASLAYATNGAVVSPLTTKGDLFTYSTTNARLAVGNNGESLVADSSTSTGLRYQGNFAAGLNKIINGDFNINQRGFTTGTTNSTFVFDRFRMFNGDGTVTGTAQTFTAGTAPVSGYEAKNYFSLQSTGQTTTTANSRLAQDIESVRTLAGQTATVSFWAKAASGTPKIAVELAQEFGSGGSSAVNTYAGQVTLSTSWARYSVTVAVPSISGKTIGTGDFLRLALWASAGSAFDSRTGTLGIQTNTIDFWGVQVQNGNVATAFQTATGTLQGELAACQRYYWRNTGGNGNYAPYGNGSYVNATNAEVIVNFPTTMRTSPSTVEFSTLATSDTATVSAVTTLTLNYSSPNAAMIYPVVAAGGVQYRSCKLVNNNNSTTAYLGFSAEL